MCSLSHQSGSPQQSCAQGDGPWTLDASTRSKVGAQRSRGGGGGGLNIHPPNSKQSKMGGHNGKRVQCRLHMSFFITFVGQGMREKSTEASHMFFDHELSQYENSPSCKARSLIADKQPSLGANSNFLPFKEPQPVLGKARGCKICDHPSHRSCSVITSLTQPP